MKVIVAHNRYTAARPSGENIMVDTDMAQLAAAGVQVIPFIRSSDDIGSLSFGQKALLPISPIWSPTSTRELAAVLDRERPDLLHLHNPYPLLSPWIVRTAHAHGVPVIQTIHNFRHVCAAATFVRDGHECHDCVGRWFPMPAVKHSCYRGSRAQSVIMATALSAHRGTWHSVDRFIALTDGMAQYLRDYGIADERITVKPNSVPDPGVVPARSSDGFLFAGRLSPEKGADLLIEAWKRHSDGSLGTLRIAGDGPSRPAMEAAVAGRTDVIFLGLLDNAATQGAMREAAVVVAPSTWNDVLPTVIIEALANGRPVLGTAVGGIPYLIGTGEPAPGGWIVPPMVDALAAALPDARSGAEAAGVAARLRYLAKFSPDVVVDQLLDAYRATIARAPSPTNGRSE
jgi:glycosyltransferase involved in cell wall biosynthesis